MKNRHLILPVLFVGALTLVGCKKEAGASQTIELPDGALHLSSQWVDGELWVESFDPKTRVCTFSEYRKGQPVEAKTVTLKNCRVGFGGPMMRPMMERGMMPEHGGMMPRPNMQQQPGHPGRMMPPQPVQSQPAQNQPTPNQPAPPEPAPVAPPLQD